MMMRSGDVWNCTNLACHAKILVQTESLGEGINPRCSCGALMKKKYTSPAFRYLDFLRVEEPVLLSRSATDDGGK
jgi:hypothetical protein